MAKKPHEEIECGILTSCDKDDDGSRLEYFFGE